MSGSRQGRLGAIPTLLPGAALALFVVNATALVGFRRLFTDWTFLTEPLVLLALSTIVAVVLRRRRVNVGLAFVVSAVLGSIATAWLLYQGTTRYGLPTADTLAQVRIDLRVALEVFRDVKAPAEILPGFIVAAAVAAWLTAFLADWAAFRLDAGVEAIIPASGLFVFGALFGADIMRVQLTVAFVLAGILFLLVHRAGRFEVGAAWVRGDAARGSRALVRLGVGLALAAVLGGLAVAPLLPGARAEAIVDWKQIGGDQGTRLTLSPLVDIRSRLVEQRDTVAFTVNADTRSYWRLTALDSFDGRVWRSSQRFTKVSDGLPPARPPSGTTAAATQEFQIENLSQIWLPAAYQPTRIAADGIDVRWEDSTSTLIVDDETSDGLTYQIESQVPRPDAAGLAAVAESAPQDVNASYLELPAGVSDRVIAEAQRITAEAATPYDKALALQNHFRANFTYSLEVQEGHSDDRLEQFLFEDRVGYCEQFAGSFAVMARAIGIPARVAVGFTPGDVDPANPTLYTVRGKHAHAWPEVYVPGQGWVLFEPTPGRGAPGAEGYTGVAEAQDSESPVPGGEQATTTTSIVGAAGAASGLGEPIPEIPIPSDTGIVEPVEEPDEDPVPTATRWVIPIVALAVAVYVVAALSWRRIVRTVRRQRAATPREQIDVAWQEMVESLEYVGLEAQPAETPLEFAARAARRQVVDQDPIDALAELTTESRYSDTDTDPDAVAEAGRSATAVLEGVKEQTTLGQRIGHELSPRSWLTRRRGGDHRNGQG